MSFILDALKKLEQKRNQEHIPDLLTVHSYPPQKPQKRLVWLSLIVIALFVNAGVLLALLKPWQSEQTQTQALLSAEQPEADSSAPVPAHNETEATPSTISEKEAMSSRSDPDLMVSSQKSGPAANNVSQPSLSSQEQMDSPSAASAGITVDTDSIPGESELSGTRSFLPDEEELAALHGKIKEEIDYSISAPSVESTNSAHSGPIHSASRQTIIEMDQLPSDIKNELPGVSINAHIYSDNPSARIVNINGIILHEGQDISRGLTLVEITEAGIILSYKDIRFRVRAF